MTDVAIAEFVQLISGGRPPKRAERSAAGFLPARAMRYCDALTSATGYGYWLFPPIDFALVWDGEAVHWSLDEGESWLPVSGTASGSVQFPDYAADFDSMCPDVFKGYSPPFLTALPEFGGIQIWSGLLAKTKPGWSLSIRGPVNLPGIPGLVPWEGIVETDLWFGPLFSNFRFTKTDSVVHVRTGAPFLQVQPVPQIAYREETLSKFAVRAAGELDSAEWADLGKVLLPDPTVEDRQGLYAVTVRKRRLCPIKPLA